MNLKSNARYLPLVGVTGLAAIFRLFRPGLPQLVFDEVNLLFWSLRMDRHGEWLWLSGNPTSWSGLPRHSPLTNYLISAVYLFTHDPRVVRLLFAVLGVLAVSLTYVMTARYINRRAALLAGVMLAVFAPAVTWSRFIWNPNWAPPLIVLWAFTALVGYVDGKRWAQVVHWVALALVVQANPGNVMLVIPSAGIGLLALYVRRGQRRPLIGWTLVGWGAAFVTAIPYLIGLLQEGAFASLNLADFNTAAAPVRTLLDLFGILSHNTSGAGFGGAERYITAGVVDWWPPAWTETLLNLNTVFVLIAGAIVLVRMRRAREKILPAAFWFLSAITGLLFIYVISPLAIQAFYLMAVVFLIVPFEAFVLERLLAARRWRPAGPLLAGAIFVTVAGLNVWLNVAALRWQDVASWTQPLRASMDTFLGLVDEWSAQGTRPVVVYADVATEKYVVNNQVLFWEVLGDGIPLRVVNWDFNPALLLPAGGATVVGLADSPALDTFFGPDEGTLTGALIDGTPVFRVIEAAPDHFADLDLLPEGADRFDNGARVLGARTLAAPEAGQNWPLQLVWQVADAPSEATYQFSLRLVDAEANRYGQHDFTPLDGDLWQVGDTVVDAIQLPVSETYPAGTPLRLQVLMYRLDDMAGANAVDEAGNVLAPWLYLAAP